MVDAITGYMQGIVHNTTSMVTHPTKPLFMVAGDKGVIQTWDLLTHKLLKTFQLPTPAAVTCMVFTHDGTILAVGSASGVVRLCRDGDLELIADFRPVRQVMLMMTLVTTYLKRSLRMGMSETLLCRSLGRLTFTTLRYADTLETHKGQFPNPWNKEICHIFIMLI